MLPTVTLRLGAEVLPCGSPASAKIHGTVTLPANVDDLPDPLPSQLRTLASEQGITLSGNEIGIEKGVAAGRSESIKVPFFTAAAASADLKLILTVSGNIDSLTVTQSVDMCLTAGVPRISGSGWSISFEFCGADLPTCTDGNRGSVTGTNVERVTKALCLASSNYNFKAALQNPPINLMTMTHNFANVCPSPPSPASSSSSSASTRTTVEFALTIDETVSSFDAAKIDTLKNNLASRMAGISASDISVTVAAGSVVVTVTITTTSATAAVAASTYVTSTDVSTLTTHLGVGTIQSKTAPTTTVVGGGMGGGAIFILIVLILIAVCAAAAAVWYFKKKPEERKATKEKFKAKMDAMKEKYKKKAATVAPDTEMETATE